MQRVFQGKYGLFLAQKMAQAAEGSPHREGKPGGAFVQDTQETRCPGWLLARRRRRIA